LDDNGRVEKLPGVVRKLEPGSIWAREGRERELHGEAEAARRRSVGNWVPTGIKEL
jgi:hypothetical protein